MSPFTVIQKALRLRLRKSMQTQAQASPTVYANTLLDMPVEILEKIVDEACNHRKTLSAFSLVNRDLRRFALPHLVRSIYITPGSLCIKAMKKMAMSSTWPGFVAHIRALSLSGHKTVLLDKDAVEQLLCCQAVTRLTLHSPLFSSKDEMQRLICGYPRLEDLILPTVSRIKRSPQEDDQWDWTRAPPLIVPRLRTLVLRSWPAFEDESTDLHHVLIVSWLEYIKVVSALEDIAFSLVYPGDLDTLRSLFNWELLNAQTLTLNTTVGLKHNRSDVPRTIEALQDKPLKTSNVFTTLHLELTATIAGMETAMVLLKCVSVFSLRKLHLDFDGRFNAYAQGGNGTTKEVQNEFNFSSPSGLEPAFDTAAFPNLEWIYITFSNIRIVKGVARLRQRFAQARAEGYRFSIDFRRDITRHVYELDGPPE